MIQTQNIRLGFTITLNPAPKTIYTQAGSASSIVSLRNKLWCQIRLYSFSNLLEANKEELKAKNLLSKFKSKDTELIEKEKVSTEAQKSRTDEQAKKKRGNEEFQKARRKEKAEISKLKMAEKLKRIKAAKKEISKAEQLHSTTPIISPPKTRSMDGLNIFILDLMAIIKEKLPTRTLEQTNQLFSEICIKWNAKSEEGKKPYKDKADQLNIKRKEELESWWDTVDKDLVALENQRRKNLNASGKREGKYRLPKLTDPRTPKKPLNPYFIFRSEVEALYKSESFEGSKQFTRQVALKWRQLSENDKSVYIEKYREASRNFFEQKEKLQKIYDSKKTSLTKPNHR